MTGYLVSSQFFTLKSEQDKGLSIQFVKSLLGMQPYINELHVVYEKLFKVLLALVQLNS